MVRESGRDPKGGPGFSLYISQDIKGNAGHHRLHCCGFAISRSKSVFQWRAPYPALTCVGRVCVCERAHVLRGERWSRQDNRVTAALGSVWSVSSRLLYYYTWLLHNGSRDKDGGGRRRETHH